MNPVDGQESKLDAQTKGVDSASSSTGSVGEQASLTRPNQIEGDRGGAGETPRDSERADLKWEADKYLENLRFFLDLSVKGFGLFYAIVGGILSIYFARNPNKSSEVVKFLLLVPCMISLSLTVIYFFGAKAAKNTKDKLNDISRGLEMGVIPNLSFVPFLIYALSFLFFVTGAALVWLYCSIS